MTLGARAFFYEFLAEFEEENKKTEWYKIYNNNVKWTAKMLGTGPSRQRGNYGLLGRIGQKFGCKNEPEWRQIDQVWFCYLRKPKECKDKPWKNEVLVEHENNINRLEYTLNKYDEKVIA